MEIDGKIYLIGGIDCQGKKVTRIREFNTNDMRVQDTDRSIVGCNEGMACAKGDNNWIYVAGGVDTKGKLSKKVLRFKVTGERECLTDMRSPKENFSLVYV